MKIEECNNMINKRFSTVSIFVLAIVIFSLFASPTDVYAGGTVGNGTPESCTEAALDAALSGGGTIVFDCGGSPVTITLTSTKSISSNTQIYGGGLVTISGNDTVRLFSVGPSIDFTITGLTLAHGYVSGENGGAININNGATVSIFNSTFDTNNTLNGYGGAIYVDTATLNITASTFVNNGADVEELGDFALGGGAIQNNDGTVTISGSTFSGNFVDSYTADGGAIYNGDFDDGPGIPDSNPDILSITNSTFYNNQLRNATGGSAGGAIRSGSSLTIIHSTFSNNDSGIASDGGEAGALTITDGDGAILKYNIFTNSSAADCAIRSSVISYTSVGNLIMNNYADPYGCGTPLLTSDPQLGVLQDNGGPTHTMALGSGSPAVDVFATCEVAVDQRGVARPQPNGGNCDIGAYELDTTAPSVSITGGPSDPTNSTSASFTFTPSGDYVSVECRLDSAPFSNCDSSSSHSYSGLANGPHTFTVKVTDAAANSSSESFTWTIDLTPPSVSSITLASTNPTNASSVDFTVTFSEAVTDVDASDFHLAVTGVTGTSITNVIGSGTTRTVTVSTGSGNGTIRLDVVDDNSIIDAAGNPLGGSGLGDGDFTSGQTYTIQRNNAPTNISLSKSTVNENLPVGTTVGTLSTIDPDAGDTFTYTFCGGTDDVSFSLTGNTLKTAAVFDYETNSSYSICIRSTDNGSLSTTKTFTITINNMVDTQTFEDVLDTYWAYSFIERLYNAGITGGCTTNPLNYCPEDTVTRAQMAVFLLRGIHGSSYSPPAVGVSTGFADVPTSHWAAAWIKQFAAEGITSGCGNGNFCPDTPVTRAQMAVFLLKSKHGVSYTPPAATGVFTDVPVGYWADTWIEQLAAEDITGGCGGGNYCPDAPVTRAQMAVFLVKTFNLP
jgi:hypothetical protein